MDDNPTKHRSSKNRKRWCRGKVGVEHTPECRDYQDVKNWRAGTMLNGWKLLVCTACGKELDTYMPPMFGVGRPIPDWAK